MKKEKMIKVRIHLENKERLLQVEELMRVKSLIPHVARVCAFGEGCVRGSRGVKVSDHDRHVMGSSPEGSDAREICRELKRPPFGVVVRRGGVVLVT
ncbi:hypothetical protein TNCV_544571 [Trichonephila clavipes]|nr:hypothetical protein TNCV_544571 [Trichonephila clavipes]